MFRHRCSRCVLRPEAPLQTDPPPRFPSPRILFQSSPRHPASHLSWCLFHLPTRWLRSPSPEDGGSQRTLHESGSAAFPVRCLGASDGWRECFADGHQEEHPWHSHGGREARHEPQDVSYDLTPAAHQKRVVGCSVQTEISNQNIQWNVSGSLTASR